MANIIATLSNGIQINDEIDSTFFEQLDAPLQKVEQLIIANYDVTQLFTSQNSIKKAIEILENGTDLTVDPDLALAYVKAEYSHVDIHLDLYLEKINYLTGYSYNGTKDEAIMKFGKEKISGMNHQLEKMIDGENFTRFQFQAIKSGLDPILVGKHFLAQDYLYSELDEQHYFIER